MTAGGAGTQTSSHDSQMYSMDPDTFDPEDIFVVPNIHFAVQDRVGSLPTAGRLLA